jgi:hypothetical protein
MKEMARTGDIVPKGQEVRLFRLLEQAWNKGFLPLLEKALRARAGSSGGRTPLAEIFFTGSKSGGHRAMKIETKEERT